MWDRDIFWYHLCNLATVILLVLVRDPNQWTWFLDFRKPASSKNVGQGHFLISFIQFDHCIVVSPCTILNQWTWFLDFRKSAHSKNFGRGNFLISFMQFDHCNFASPCTRPKSMKLVSWLSKIGFIKECGRGRFSDIIYANMSLKFCYSMYET